ncbi:MAG TPA: RnfH family protein [Ramlibacter sp.]|nr:RnfH family protein [Ramlibacter sp.]
MRITLMFSAAPRQVDQRDLQLPEGASVRDALEQSGLLADHPQLREQAPSVGIWGRKAALDQPLREGDRVEVYRPLKVDPKLARRERFRMQGSRAAGLFARKPDGDPKP